MRLVVFLWLAVCSLGADVRIVPLFTIEKNTNANRVHYDAHLTNGKFDAKQPVVAYWIMAAEDGRRQELNFLERAKAYGFSIRPDSVPNSYRLTVVSDKKKEIRVYLDQATVRAEAIIAGRRAILEKIMIIAHKSWLLSLPDYAEMIGIDVATGERRSERVTPADR